MPSSIGLVSYQLLHCDLSPCFITIYLVPTPCVNFLSWKVVSTMLHSEDTLPSIKNIWYEGGVKKEAKCIPLRNSILSFSNFSVYEVLRPKNTLHNVYESLWGPIKASVQNGVTGSYMHAVFKLVVYEEPEIWTSLPHSLSRKAYYSSQVSRISVCSLRISKPTSTRNGWHD